MTGQGITTGRSAGAGGGLPSCARSPHAEIVGSPILERPPRRYAGEHATGGGAEGLKLRHTTITLAEANAYVRRFHRHHRPVVGHKFSIGAILGDQLVGAVIVGRPVSRIRDDGRTLEVTRLCTDGTRNACSFLYGAAAKAAFALGYERIGTYSLPSEGGASLRACDWKLLGERGGGSWDCPSRPRTDQHPTDQKWLWEKSVNTGPDAATSAAGNHRLNIKNVPSHGRNHSEGGFQRGGTEFRESGNADV